MRADEKRFGFIAIVASHDADSRQDAKRTYHDLGPGPGAGGLHEIISRPSQNYEPLF